MNIRTLIQHVNSGVIPERIVTAEDRKVWNIRLDLANLMGLSDEDIEKNAKKLFENHVKRDRGAGRLGNETWEKDCEPWRKFHYIDRLLPNIECLKHTPNAVFGCFSEKPMLIVRFPEDREI